MKKKGEAIPHTNMYAFLLPEKEYDEKKCKQRDGGCNGGSNDDVCVQYECDGGRC